VGLRLILGTKDEKNREWDFLSSVEIVILDQADVYLMQNWEHVETLFSSLNKIPIAQHKTTDYSRMRLFNLNDWAKYFRQTLI